MDADIFPRDISSIKRFHHSWVLMLLFDFQFRKIDFLVIVWAVKRTSEVGLDNCDDDIVPGNEIAGEMEEFDSPLSKIIVLWLEAKSAEFSEQCQVAWR